MVAVLTTVLVSTIAACTGDPKPSQPGAHTSGTTSAVPQIPGALGAPGCHPASPVTVLNSFLSRVQGTGQGATLWGLLMFPQALPARVGDQEKIVWRMTGTGSLSMEAIDPAGTHHPLAWGPDSHLSSDWDKPGDEWGAGYRFDAPGCWDLRAARGTTTADVWLRVVSRSPST